MWEKSKVKFKYRRFNSPSPFSKRQNLLRSIIPVSLSNNYLSLRFEALVDSGADFCIFPTGIAKRLGINLSTTKKIYFSSATGDMVKGFINDVYLEIGGNRVKTKVVFADLAGNTGILGQYGFFDLFVVKFDLKKKEIELKTRR